MLQVRDSYLSTLQSTKDPGHLKDLRSYSSMEKESQKEKLIKSLNRRKNSPEKQQSSPKMKHRSKTVIEPKIDTNLKGKRRVPSPKKEKPKLKKKFEEIQVKKEE